MVHLQHEDTNVDSDTGPLLHPEQEPGLEPFSAADVLRHRHPWVQGQGLAGQPLLAGVGVSQGQGQVEEPGVPLPPPDPLQHQGEQPRHLGAALHHQAEVLLLRADCVGVDPKCRIYYFSSILSITTFLITWVSSLFSSFVSSLNLSLFLSELFSGDILGLVKL